jgi:hypothetical protein
MNKAERENKINKSNFIKDNQQGSLNISGNFGYNYLYTKVAGSLRYYTTLPPTLCVGRSVEPIKPENLNEYLNEHLTVELNELMSTLSNKTSLPPVVEIEKIRDINDPNYLYFLGGFVEGEGSNSVAVSVGKEFKFGVNLQPIFNVSQHVNGINILYSFKELFGAGSVVQKSGSEDI